MKPTWKTDDNAIQLYRGDMLEILPRLPEGFANFILLDLPYGITALAWDQPLDLSEAWRAVNGATWPTGIVAAFGVQPFTTDLISANRKRFRYEVIWRKSVPTGFLDANRRPLRDHENVLIFCERLGGSIYRPQFTQGKPYSSTRGGRCLIYGKESGARRMTSDGRRYPRSVWEIASEKGRGRRHTRKPAALVEKLIRTYSDPHDVVLDPCIGSGTTILAAIRSGRRAVGIEKDRARFREALETIKTELATPARQAA